MGIKYRSEFMGLQCDDDRLPLLRSLSAKNLLIFRYIRRILGHGLRSLGSFLLLNIREAAADRPVDRPLSFS